MDRAAAEGSDEARLVAERVREAGERARAEAEDRRSAGSVPARSPREIGGAGGLDPVRYGDWDVKGRAIDF